MACGRLISKTMVCFNCSVVNPSGHRYCDHCGTQFHGLDEPADIPKEKISMPGLSVFGKINVSWLHGSKIAFALLAITIAVALFVRCYGLETIPNQIRIVSLMRYSIVFC